MKKMIVCAISAIVLILMAGGSFAATYWVNPGESIQNAIDLAANGDTITVAQGTYYENINFNGKNIVLTSIDPEDTSVVVATIIDGSMPDNPDSGSVVTFAGSENTTCVLTAVINCLWVRRDAGIAGTKLTLISREVVSS